MSARSRVLRDSETNRQLLASSRKVTKFYKLAAFSVCLLMLGTGLGVMISADGPTGFGTVIEPGSMVEDARFIIFQDSGITYAKNGTTGRIEESGADAAIVFSLAISATEAMGGGRICIQDGDYEIDSSINATASTDGTGILIEGGSYNTALICGVDHIRMFNVSGRVSFQNLFFNLGSHHSSAIYGYFHHSTLKGIQVFGGGPDAGYAMVEMTNGGACSFEDLHFYGIGAGGGLSFSASVGDINCLVGSNIIFTRLAIDAPALKFYANAHALAHATFTGLWFFDATTDLATPFIWLEGCDGVELADLDLERRPLVAYDNTIYITNSAGRYASMNAIRYVKLYSDAVTTIYNNGISTIVQEVMIYASGVDFRDAQGTYNGMFVQGPIYGTHTWHLSPMSQTQWAWAPGSINAVALTWASNPTTPSAASLGGASNVIHDGKFRLTLSFSASVNSSYMWFVVYNDLVQNRTNMRIWMESITYGNVADMDAIQLMEVVRGSWLGYGADGTLVICVKMLEAWTGTVSVQFIVELG